MASKKVTYDTTLARIAGNVAPIFATSIHPATEEGKQLIALESVALAKKIVAVVIAQQVLAAVTAEDSSVESGS